MARILVLGKHGQLASEIADRVKDSREYRFCARDEFSPKDPSALEALLELERPEFVINCAAYTAVDKAESDRDECFLVNRDFVRRLAQSSAARGFHLIHFSTDYVFNGAAGKPYRETDAVDPVNTYGQSKLEGEKAIYSHAKSATVVRTSWVYSRHGQNFVKTMLRLARAGTPLKVVSDQTGCPTWAGDLAALTIDRLLKRTGQVDLYNYSGAGETTWCEFAKEIFEISGIDHPVTAISTEEFPTPARRPKYSVLSKQKIQSDLAIVVPHWRESLSKCLETWEKT